MENTTQFTRESAIQPMNWFEGSYDTIEDQQISTSKIFQGTLDR